MTMTRKQREVIEQLSRPVGTRGRLLEALKRKFKTPKECLKALGLDAALLDTGTAVCARAPPREARSSMAHMLLPKDRWTWTNITSARPR